jgi:hypothetical protein
MKYLLPMMPFLAQLGGQANGQLVIHAPQTLVNLFKADTEDANDGLINCNYANFGFVPYGHSMVSSDDFSIFCMSNFH